MKEALISFLGIVVSRLPAFLSRGRMDRLEGKVDDVLETQGRLLERTESLPCLKKKRCDVVADG